MAKQEAIVEIDRDVLLKAYHHMCLAREMARIYDENRQITQYVHSTSRGHEAIQLAAAFQLKPYDWVSPYYRDESLLLGMGFTPLQLMLQLLAKRDDPFTGGRSYYAHANSNDPDKPKMIHQSSATGMQAIPTPGIAQGIQYREKRGLDQENEKPVVLCSIGDGAMTEGEVAEALQFAALHQLPIIYLVQDNNWGISVTAAEARSMDAYEYAAGFKGLDRIRVDGSDFIESYRVMEETVDKVRKERRPILVHARVPLLGHHTSGVRKEWYRPEDDLKKHEKDDPGPKLKEKLLREFDFREEELENIEREAKKLAEESFEKAKNAPEPDPKTAADFVYAPTPVTEEQGVRNPGGKEKIVMVDAALHAVDDILRDHPEALFYGQDVGGRLGGVFREAATLAEKYGSDRVFNTAIQEAYIIGSTAGLSAFGLRPIVEVQFADYLWPGMNQLVTELAKACYLTLGKFPVASVIRIPAGAYGGGGPYHSGCHESSILPIKGVKVVFPSNAADIKGLMKAAFLDPNPVVIFEHKGLYWSKVPGTLGAKTVEPDENYIVPIGKANVFLEAFPEKVAKGESVVVITYGMGVHWALNAANRFRGNVEILDLRTLQPLDEEAVMQAVKKHNKVLLLTEETLSNSFIQTLGGRIANEAFEFLDAPVQMIGAKDVPAIPLNTRLEAAILPNADIVSERIEFLLHY